MRHPTRAFKAEARELEGRLLMASTLPPSALQFVGSTGDSSPWGWPSQIVTQQAGKATVTLSRTETAGPLQVEVTMDPNMWSSSGTDTASPEQVGLTRDRQMRSSVLQGGIVGAVDQTVTFAPGQSLATVTVPIVAGAPNPGAVDVTLRAAPIGASSDSLMPSPLPLDLRIVASDPTLPPKVVSVLASNQGIALTFNKPMDPVGASNVNNYSVFQVNSVVTYGFLKYPSSTWRAKPVQFESAQYDPATQTVTLIPKHPILYISSTWSELKRARRSVRTAHSSNVAPGLTDLQGNPINADTTPGKVEYRVVNHPGIL